MKKHLVLLFLMLAYSITIQAAYAHTNPVKCKIGIYIKTLKVNQLDEEFTAQFYWWARVDSINPKVDYSWVTDFEFINSSSELEILQEITNYENGYYYSTGICEATFPFKADYHLFPYDRQILQIRLENTTYNRESVLYLPDDKSDYINNLNENPIDVLNGEGIFIEKLSCSTSTKTYNTNFGDPSISLNDAYSRLTFNISIARNPNSILLKLALPLLVVLILAYLVFYIPDDEIGTASGLTVTSLLAAIAFQWTINDSLPKVNYFTLVDKIFYLVYFFIFYAMAQTIITYNLAFKGETQKKLSTLIERHSRWMFPTLFIILLTLILNG
jgi:hypothetical protein